MADQLTVTYKDTTTEVIASGTNAEGGVTVVKDAYGKSLEWIPTADIKKIVNTGS